MIYKNRYIIILLSFVVFFSFFKLGQHPINVFDEARNGINAIEMLQTGDWINLRFGGKPDEWNLKPPLLIWSIATSFNFFGYNVLSLRLPSALAIIISFFLLFKIINLYQSQKFALYTCLLLTSVKGIIGFHVGRSGDFDAMLLLFSLAGLYYFLKYINNSNSRHVYISALFFGLAFMTKGWAMVLYPIGLFLYLFVAKTFLPTIKKKSFWLAISLFLMFPIAWFFCIYFYGASHSGVQGKNAFYSMFYYDIIARFTESNFEGNESGFLYYGIFPQMDAQYNLWNYFLYLITGLGLYHYISLKKKINLKANQLFLISCCLLIPMMLFFNFTLKQRYWYTAPAIPFLGIITFSIYDKLKVTYPFLKALFFGLLVFTLLRQAYKFNNINAVPEIFSQNEQMIKKADTIIKFGKTEWNTTHTLLNLIFINPNVQYDSNTTNVNKADNILIFSNKKYIDSVYKKYPDFHIHAIDQDFCIFKKLSN